MTARRRIEALEAYMITRTKMNRDPVFEAAREKAILEHPDSRRVAAELLRTAIGCAEAGKDPDLNPAIAEMCRELLEIGGGHWNPLGVLITHDDAVRELAYRLMDAEAEKDARQRRAST